MSSHGVSADRPRSASSSRQSSSASKPTKQAEPKKAEKAAPEAPKDRATVSEHASEKETDPASHQEHLKAMSSSLGASDNARTLRDAPSGEPNCIDKAAAAARPDDQALFLHDNRPDDANQAGHVILQRDGSYLDPSSGRSYTDQAAFLKENPQYGQEGQLDVRGQTSGEKLQAIVGAGSQSERDAAINAAGLGNIADQRFADRPDNNRCEVAFPQANVASRQTQADYADIHSRKEAAEKRLGEQILEAKARGAETGKPFSATDEDAYRKAYWENSANQVDGRPMEDVERESLEKMAGAQRDLWDAMERGDVSRSAGVNADAANQLVEGYQKLANSPMAKDALEFASQVSLDPNSRVANLLKQGGGNWREKLQNEMVGPGLVNNASVAAAHNPNDAAAAAAETVAPIKRNLDYYQGRCDVSSQETAHDYREVVDAATTCLGPAGESAEKGKMGEAAESLSKISELEVHNPRMLKGLKGAGAVLATVAATQSGEPSERIQGMLHASGAGAEAMADSEKAMAYAAKFLGKEAGPLTKATGEMLGGMASAMLLPGDIDAFQRDPNAANTISLLSSAAGAAMPVAAMLGAEAAVPVLGWVAAAGAVAAFGINEYNEQQLYRQTYHGTMTEIGRQDLLPPTGSQPAPAEMPHG